MAALVLSLLALAASASFGQEISQDDYRRVSFSELKQTLDRFSPPGVTAFSEILFDIQKYQMIVGARDHVYRLSVRGLQELEAVHWPPSPHDATLCEIKGQPAADCRNYVRVLLGLQERLLVCGTNAFQPRCQWRRLESLRTVLANETGVAVCPYSPHLNVTSLLTAEGDIVAGTATDFSGLDPAVYRRGGRRDSLRTGRYDSRLLSAPQFVGSFETRHFVYFVFREHAVEFNDCGKRVVSRIARVCKNDPGNRRGEWTTFLKARLNCSVSGEYPFYLDHVQSVHYLDTDEMLYATFTAPENGLAGSAVCRFTLSAIEEAFDGPLRRLKPPGGVYRREEAELRHRQCGGDVLESPGRRRLADLPPYALTARAVQPTTHDPLALLDGVSFSGIATDVITTKHHVAVHVIFVSDEAGNIRKLSVVPRSQKTCLVELLQPFEKPTKILTMKLLKEEGSLYLGTESGLVRLPVQRCGRYTSEQSCLAAMDPYCGWDAVGGVCSPPPGRNPDVGSWSQLVTQCPDRSRPLDGGWTGWSGWQPCAQAAAQPEEDGEPDRCQCRRRVCSRPAPANGGRDCAGLATQVTNCTRHGGWTSWSAWSACSHSCGVASKSRRRSCTNPAPAHGGRACVGEESQQIMCHSNPPCPSLTDLPVDGGWGGWSDWGPCSVACGGGGFRRRHRVCDSPRPANGGLPCAGCDSEYGGCGPEPCPVVRQLTPWTPWLAANATDGRQQRFRFACRAPVADADLIRVSNIRRDERICSPDGRCSHVDPRGHGWGEWSEWTACSKPCGTGFQTRSRTCEAKDGVCRGREHMEQECNTHSCQGEWSCWSEWSQCSVSCGIGQRSRTRTCRNKATQAEEGAVCDGSDISRESCEMPSCTSTKGWGEWTVWSACDSDGEQHRRRRCLKSDPDPDICQGHERESRICVTDADGQLRLASTGADLILAGPSGGGGGVSAGMLALGCVLSFVLGALLAAVATYCWLLARWRRQREKSARLFNGKPQPKQLAPGNTYVTLRGLGRGGARGVEELAELKSGRRLVSGPPPAVSPLMGAGVRRSGGNRYDAVSSDDLRVDLGSDAMY